MAGFFSIERKKSNNESNKSLTDSFTETPESKDGGASSGAQPGTPDLDDLKITIETVLPSFDGKKWYQLPHIRLLCCIVFLVSLSAGHNGYDASLLNSLYTMKDYNNAIGNVSGPILGALTSAFTIGALISFFVTARINDILGRRKALIIGNIIMLVGVIVNSFSGAWVHGIPENNKNRSILGMMIGARIIVGFGTGILTVAAPSLISELAFPTHRQVSVTVYNSSWYLGAIFAAWLTYGVRNLKHHWNWRLPCILQCTFCIIQVIGVPLLVPESPRWLISKNRVDEAKVILDKYHGGGFEDADVLVDYEITEIQISIDQERAANGVFNYRDFIKTKANMKRLWIFTWLSIFVTLSGNGLVSYYLGKVLISIGYTSTSKQLVINAGLMMFNYGSCIIQSFLIVPRLRRRQVFLTSLAGMLVCYIVWTALSAVNQQTHFKNQALGQGVLAMIFLYFFFYNLGMNGISFTYVTEILPFTMRAKGMNLYASVQYMGTLYNGFVNPIAMDAIDWKYYIVYCCVLGVEFMVCYFTFVETSGRTLEEVAEVFGDGIQDLSKVSGISTMEDGKISKAVEMEHLEKAE